MNADFLSKLRIAVLGSAGLICLAYAVLSVTWNTPQPFSPWLPGAAGVAAGATMWLCASYAGKRAAGAAYDELYQLEWGQALKISYWIAIALYPIFAIVLNFSELSGSTIFAAMGTATGAAPMLVYCIINLRG